MCAVGEALRWAVGQALLEVDDYSIRLRPEDLRLIVRLLVDQLIESECFPTALAWLRFAWLAWLGSLALRAAQSMPRFERCVRRCFPAVRFQVQS